MISEAPFAIKGDTTISQTAAFFDLDGTLTSAHVWQGIIDYFKEHNLRRWTHFGYMAYHFPLYILMKAGLISDESFRKPWPLHLGWYLRGYSISEADQIWDWVAESKVSQTWRKDVCQILNQHRERGDLTFLVSGTPLPLLERLAGEMNVDHVIGTRLEIIEGRFTGRSSSPACIGTAKVSLTQDYLHEVGIEINFEASHAYADSLSDQHMLAMVGSPVATYPEEQLKALAVERGWQIFPAE
jgi:HAD superfamily hydrolase (TIGR01490 family)